MKNSEIEWKPVSELPEEHKDVLIAIKGSPAPVQTGFRCDDRWFYTSGYRINFPQFGYTVTHWAYLPEPPK